MTRLAGTDEDCPPSVSTAVAVSTGVTSAVGLGITAAIALAVGVVVGYAAKEYAEDGRATVDE